MKKKVTIEGMSCGHCSNRVEKALKQLMGVEEVKVDLQQRSAVVEYNGQLPDDEIRQTIEEVGYDVTNIQSI